MVDSGTLRPGYNRVDGALLPDGAGTTHAWVHEGLLRHLYKRARWRFFNLVTAVEVLRKPAQVWRCVLEVGDADLEGYAYVGLPPCLRTANGETHRRPLDQVLIVFLDSRFTMVEWRTEEIPPSGFVDSGRFEELLWSR